MKQRAVVLVAVGLLLAGATLLFTMRRSVQDPPPSEWLDSTKVGISHGPGSSPAVAPSPEFMACFQEASQEFGIPVEVLVAISYTETSWKHYPHPPTSPFGLMGLRDYVDDPESPLKEAAQLIGLPPDSLRNSPCANARGAAAWLSREFDAAHGEQDRATRMKDAENWRPVLARYHEYSAVLESAGFKTFKRAMERESSSQP